MENSIPLTRKCSHQKQLAAKNIGGTYPLILAGNLKKHKVSFNKISAPLMKEMLNTVPPISR